MYYVEPARRLRRRAHVATIIRLVAAVSVSVVTVVMTRIFHFQRACYTCRCHCGLLMLLLGNHLARVEFHQHSPVCV
jgi:hypothetical protein